MKVDALLLDIDGVLAVSWEPIPGSIDTLSWLRARDFPFRLITNTTTHTRAKLAETLNAAGFDVVADEIVTAVVATGVYLRTAHPGARVFLLSDGNAQDDLEGVQLVGSAEPAEVVVIGGASEAFTYDALNHAFRLLMEGAALVGMHRNLYWRTAEGLNLDGGAYIAGLEEAAGINTTVCGKPAPTYFEAALGLLGAPASRVAMVGDDIVNDVIGAQAVGITGILVKTGKFLPTDLSKGKPDVVLETLADLPAWLQADR
jgi:HAD superfamily hydrolase (TIGR01458 family)